MRRGVAHFQVLQIVIGVLLTGPKPASADNASPPLNDQLRGVRLDQRLNEIIPLDDIFKNEQGEPARLADFFDGRRPVILTLVYFRCPMLCTLVLNDTLRSIRAMSSIALGKDFQVITVSFSPTEGPDLASAKKGHYLTELCRGLPIDRQRANDGWHFLTGSEASIRRLTEAVGFHYRWDAKFEQYAHPSGIVILTPRGKIARYFFGIGYEPNDLRLSLVEASHGTIGGGTEQFLLGCFHYDPTRGRYSFAILNALKAGAVLALVGLAGLYWAMARYNRRRAERASMPLPGFTDISTMTRGSPP